MQIVATQNCGAVLETEIDASRKKWEGVLGKSPRCLTCGNGPLKARGSFVGAYAAAGELTYQSSLMQKKQIHPGVKIFKTPAGAPGRDPARLHFSGAGF